MNIGKTTILITILNQNITLNLNYLQEMHSNQAVCIGKDNQTLEMQIWKSVRAILFKTEIAYSALHTESRHELFQLSVSGGKQAGTVNMIIIPNDRVWILKLKRELIKWAEKWIRKSSIGSSRKAGTALVSIPKGLSDCFCWVPVAWQFLWCIVRNLFNALIRIIC